MDRKRTTMWPAVIIMAGIIRLIGGSNICPMIQRIELGVIMQSGKIITTSDESHITQVFVIKIPELKPPMNVTSIYEQCQENLDGMCRNINQNRTILFEGICDNIKATETWMDSATAELIETRKGMIKRAMKGIRKEGEDVTRNKRSIISDGFYYLFGFGRAEDTAKNEKRIEVLEQNTKVIGNALRKLATATDKTFQEMSGKIGEMSDRQKQFRGMIQDIDTKTKYIAHRLGMISLALYQQSIADTHESLLIRVKWGYMLHVLYEMIRVVELTSDIETAKNNRLPAKLITPDAIQEALRNTNHYLKENYPRFRVAFTNPNYYYENSYIDTYREGGKVMIDLGISVISEQHLYCTYQVRAIPLPVRVEGKEADGAVMTGLPAEIAVSMNGRYYITEPVVNWARCHGNTITICPDIPHMRKVSETGCVAALIRNDRTGVEESCEVDYIIKPKFPALAIPLQNGKTLVSGPEIEGQLLCKSNPPVVIVIHHFAVINIGCDCAFMTAGAWMPYSLRGCNKVQMMNNVSYVINDLLKTKTFRRIGYRKTTYDGNEIQALPHDPLPPIIRSQLEHRAAYTRSPAHIAINQLEEAVIEGRLGMDEGFETKMNSEVHRLAGYGSSGILLIVIILIAACCCCNYRRIVTGMMLSTAGTQGAHADKQWGMQDLDKTQQNCPEPEGGPDTQLTSVIVMLVVAIIVATWAMRKWRQEKKKQPADGLYVQLASKQLVETIPLGESIMPLDQIFQKPSATPLIKDANVSYACRGHVARLHWGRTVYATEMASGESAIPLPLPTTIKVSKALANVLEGDHTEAVMARLLRFSGGVSSAVPIDMPMISMAGWSPLGNRNMEVHSFRGEEHRRAIQQLNINAAARELPRTPVGMIERREQVRVTPAGATNLINPMDIYQEVHE